MKTRTATLQAQYLFRSTQLPEDTLLAQLLPYIQTSNSQSNWYKLAQSALWKIHCTPILSTLDKKKFKTIRNTFLSTQFKTQVTQSDSMLLSSCRNNTEIDPILWLPMTTSERSRVLRWRLGWLPGGKPKDCIFHPNQHWSRRHAFECLHMHSRLCMPISVEDPISLLLNLSPIRKPRRLSTCVSWITLWPIVCTILHELDYYFHDELPPTPIDPGLELLNWLPKS